MNIPAHAKSWVEVAPESHFPIQNIPFGLACIDDREAVVVRIGDFALNVSQLPKEGLLDEHEFPDLSGFSNLDRWDLAELRSRIYDLLREDNSRLRDNPSVREKLLLPVEGLDMLVPLEIPAFVDFYSGIYHASNVGKMFRPDMPPLLPNYRELPVGYNGRASSVVPTGSTITRPKGQIKVDGSARPVFEPTRELDFELELGFFLAQGNELGEPIPIERAEAHMLGFVMVNDWSARDIQRWEYQPLGPFLAKSFATSISPWIVTLDALEPFRIAGPIQDPEPLEYLRSSKPAHFDIHLEVSIQTQRMTNPQVISRSNARHLYWSFAQQLAHQTSNGTNSEAGDLYASGTISGPAEGSFGSLLELTWRGVKPITLTETGETRRFLECGDVVRFVGYCEGAGYRIGFGELVNQVIG